MHRCWLFYGDVWGFSELARKDQDKALRSLREALQALKTLRDAAPSVEYFLFSDTILCLREIPDQQKSSIDSMDAPFDEILVAVQFLITELIAANILLRGVIVFGSLHREGGNEIIFGDALLDAAEFERKAIAPPLVFLPSVTLQKARKARCYSRNYYMQNLEHSLYVETKDGGIIRAQPLLGDRPSNLQQNLQEALDNMTLGDRILPREAGALKAALDIVISTVNKGSRNE